MFPDFLSPWAPILFGVKGLYFSISISIISGTGIFSFIHFCVERDVFSLAFFALAGMPLFFLILSLKRCLSFLKTGADLPTRFEEHAASRGRALRSINLQEGHFAPKHQPCDRNSGVLRVSR
jgi:hypothetical protein